MKKEETNNSEFSMEIPFDMLELPSKGLLYPGRKPVVKVEYFVTADENILVSPNLIKNGKVFEVLLNRKVKELGFDVRDMLIGDRNAILLWLRASAYGEMYPVKLTDPSTGDEFEHNIDLSKLDVKELGATPDENGEFTFELPKTKKTVKFRFLTGRDEDDLMKIMERKMKIGGLDGVSNLLTSRLEKQITEIDGNRDIMFISRFIQVLPAFDSLKFREYVNSIEPGIDMKVNVEAPSGENFRITLPITTEFFWPNTGV